ncbi:hypothetical protein JCM11491_002531 [Sporobolomyces phaffii]
MTAATSDDRPFSALSASPDHPHSVWDDPHPTTINPLGRLALITPELVRRAAQDEIRTGERFSLDLTIENGAFTLFGRKKAERTVRRIDKCAPTKQESDANGELCGLFYGGATVEDVAAGKAGRGMAAWAEAGGIAKKHDIAFDPCLQSHQVPLDVIKEIAKEQGVEFRRGDIFILRTGYETRFNELKANNQLDRIGGTYAGIAQGTDVLEFLWNEGFVAVAGDQPAFEAWPAAPDKLLHPVLLSGWMLPIGELLALEHLAQHCEEQARWTFYFSAMPLKVEHGLASTGQTLAIF